jgi:trehalose 6-phosphate synthase
MVSDTGATMVQGTSTAPPEKEAGATMARRPVVAVANRLPVQHGPDGWELSPGGLVTALRPVMERGSGTWVGWDGGAEGAPRSLPELSIDLLPVSLSAEEVADYYHGFSNRTLWPLLHNAVEKPVFERDWWRAYRSVNAAFAKASVEALEAQPGALLWVHDYHLMLVPDLVRQQLPHQPIGYFLHVPWPSPDLYARMPWRADVLRGLLGADVVSFHTDGYRRNFVQACTRILGSEEVTVHGSDLRLAAGRLVRTTASPISIDADAFASLGCSPATGTEIALLERQFAGRKLMLGVDRLDYTKGIVERLLAIELLLERREDLRAGLAFMQVAVPSRDDVQEYRDLRATVEQTVGRINGRFSRPGHDVPVQYLYRGLAQPLLAAYYAVADLLLVTPLMDGMNLVAKEYVVVQQARRRAGILVLSEFTGAALELRAATACNPYDVEGLSGRIEHALELPERARRQAITVMARRVRAHDVHRWVDGQLAAIAEATGRS